MNKEMKIKSSGGLVTEDQKLKRDDAHEAHKGKHSAET
jgi:hypothetical protein